MQRGRVDVLFIFVVWACGPGAAHALVALPTHAGGMTEPGFHQPQQRETGRYAFRLLFCLSALDTGKE